MQAGNDYGAGGEGPQAGVSGDGKDDMGAQREQFCPRESGLGLACADAEEGLQGVCEAVSGMAGVCRRGGRVKKCGQANGSGASDKLRADELQEHVFKRPQRCPDRGQARFLKRSSSLCPGPVFSPFLPPVL